MYLTANLSLNTNECSFKSKYDEYLGKRSWKSLSGRNPCFEIVNREKNIGNNKMNLSRLELYVKAYHVFDSMMILN